LNNNIIIIDNNITGSSDKKFDILMNNINQTNQINLNLAIEISNLVKKINDLNNNIGALVKQNQALINELIHDNSQSLKPNENTENKNHS